MSSSPKPSKTKPLSAYNLFFQYNRIKLLEVTNGKVFTPLEPEPSMPPGLEDIDPNSPLLSAPEHEIRLRRKQVIEHALDNSPFNAKGRRSKKLSQGSMTFLEMSDYMSKKWNDASEITKIIFQELSSERKAKAQKLEFDHYKKSAERFALPVKPVVTRNFNAKCASMPILSERVVSLDTIGSSPRLWTEQIQSSSPNMANASWDEPFCAMKNDVTPMSTISQPRPLKKVSSIGPAVRMIGSVPNVGRASCQSVIKELRNGSIKSIKPLRQEASTNIVQSSAFKYKRNSMNVSNFDWEEPFASTSLDRGLGRDSSPDIHAIESLERPLSPSGRNVAMENSELSDWLSGLDWSQI